MGAAESNNALAQSVEQTSVARLGGGTRPFWAAQAGAEVVRSKTIASTVALAEADGRADVLARFAVALAKF